jgi:CIC family chloride channel protein
MGSLLDRWHPPQELVLFGTALFVGVFTGLGAVLFRYLISGVAWIGYEWVPDTFPGLNKAYVIIVPAIGGLIVGLLIYYLAREAKGHGVPEVMEAVALRGGRIRPRVAVVKSVASSICIGSGGSAGREGPIVQIGSAIGSTVGQVLNLSDNRISNLVACGAAAGIAATFNAPIAGVIFALEIILGRFSVRNFSTVVVAAVAASVVGRAALGDVPAFSIPSEYGVNSIWEFLFYPILGVLAAAVGVLFTRSLYWSEDVADSFKRVPEWVKPAVGGAMLGVLALGYPLFGLTQPVTWTRVPHVFNVGYDVIESVLSNELVFSAALILLIAKIIATCLTLGSGGSGGVFAPSLFMGAMVGAAFELGVNRLFPGISAPPGAYALVGMAAVFAASAHAPITAVIILFELTGDYRIILPLMLTVVVATVLSQLVLRGESIYTLKLSRRGVRLDRGRDVDILQGIMVGEVMAHDIATVSTKTTLAELADVFTRSHHHGLIVLDEGDKLWGIVTLTDLDRALSDNKPKSTLVTEVATTWPNLQIAYPDESIGVALGRMGSRGLGRIPVVSREDRSQFLGLLRREGIIRAYTLALTQRAEIQEQAKRLTIHDNEGLDFVEITLAATDAAVGKTVGDIALSMPDDYIIVSIKRGDRLIIPHGDTVYEIDDQVTAFGRTRDVEQLLHCLRGRKKV